MIKRSWHFLIATLLKAVGLDFRWYQIFYRRVVHALPIVEPLLQLLRTRRRAEQQLAAHLPHAIPRSGIVLDIGANVGSVSSLFLTLGLNVHAYEPDSRCVELLKRRFAWVAPGRIVIHHCAVSDQAGTVTLNYGSLTTESNSIVVDKPGADGTTGSERVNALAIADILNEHGYVDLIKMDVEGAEYDILQVMLEQCLDRFDACLVEVHANKIPALKPRHDALVETVARKHLEDRVILTWH